MENLPGFEYLAGLFYKKETSILGRFVRVKQALPKLSPISDPENPFIWQTLMQTKPGSYTMVTAWFAFALEINFLAEAVVLYRNPSLKYASD